MLISVIIIILLALIAYSDFKERLVPVWLFLALALLLGIQGLLNLPLKKFAGNFSINMVIIAFMLTFVNLYFWIKTRRLIDVLDNYLGRGDLVFMIISGVYFSPFLFVGFQVVSILLLLFFFGIYILFTRSKKFPVPMAGGQAILLLVLESSKLAGLRSVQYHDNFVLNYLLSFLC
jgi:hypothetical protein